METRQVAQVLLSDRLLSDFLTAPGRGDGKKLIALCRRLGKPMPGFAVGGRLMKRCERLELLRAVVSMPSGAHADSWLSHALKGKLKQDEPKNGQKPVKEATFIDEAVQNLREQWGLTAVEAKRHVAAVLQVNETMSDAAELVGAVLSQSGKVGR